MRARLLKKLRKKSRRLIKPKMISRHFIVIARTDTIQCWDRERVRFASNDYTEYDCISYNFLSDLEEARRYGVNAMARIMRDDIEERELRKRLKSM